MATCMSATKENLIRVMLIPCDGDKPDEIVLMHRSTQDLLLGPMQVNARINRGQKISKDPILWNCTDTTCQ